MECGGSGNSIGRTRQVPPQQVFQCVEEFAINENLDKIVEYWLDLNSEVLVILLLDLV